MTDSIFPVARESSELGDLTSDLIRLGAMVGETVPRGTEIFLSGELHEIQQLIDDDDEIDRLSIEIEERCQSYMVRQSPKAGELRLVVTATKLVAELERSADLMVNVCKAARRIYGSPMSPKIRGVVAAMAKEAARLLRLSIDAFADCDEALAVALDDIDDELDQLNRDMVAAIFEAHNEGSIDLQVAVQLALVARYYERIGDHAVNIGQRVNYMVTGWLPEHDGAARALRKAQASPEPRSEPSVGDARLIRAMSAVPLGIVIGDAEGNVVFENDFMADFASGRHSDALVQAAVAELMAEARKGAKAQKAIDVYGPPRRFLELWGTPIVEGSPVNDSMVIVEDVTEARRLEDVRRDFVANVSHELKTPVGAIGVLAETLVGSEDPAVMARLSERLQSESFRLANTIDDLLALSRIESGETFEQAPVRVDYVIAGAIERATSAAERREVTLEVRGLDTLGTTLCLLGDRSQLVSAVGNLVDNAVSYSDVGSTVQIKVALVDQGTAQLGLANVGGSQDYSGQLFELSVSDTGTGIPESDLERIFERFYRVDPARSRQTGGTGLGLSIVRHVMLNHGGEVGVESQEGQGSTFTLRFGSLLACSQDSADAASTC